MSSGFVSEKDIAEAKKVRQLEWEKVRTPDQPIERPEEPSESRSLFERLQEQKIKKDMEFDETHKLKNLIRGLEDDEVQFLDLIDQNKMEAEKRHQIEEAKELKEFRERVATLHEHTIENKIHTELSKPKPKATSSRPSQKSLLGGGVVRKRPISESNDKETDTVVATKISKETEKIETAVTPDPVTPEVEEKVILEDVYSVGAFKCIGILPGIGRYQDSSDSEISTDSEEDLLIDNDKFDLVGRKRAVPGDKGGC